MNTLPGKISNALYLHMGFLKLANVLLLIVFLAAGNRLFAQTGDRPAYEGFQSGNAVYHWTTSNGLPQSHISGITQSKNRLLWLGTYNGVVSFDGRRFNRLDLSKSHPKLSAFITAIKAFGDTVTWATAQEVVSYADGKVVSVTPVTDPNVFIMNIQAFRNKTWFLAHDHVYYRSGGKLVALISTDSESKLKGSTILTGVFANDKLTCLLRKSSGETLFYTYDFRNGKRTLLPTQLPFENLALYKGQLAALSGNRWFALDSRLQPAKTVYTFHAPPVDGRVQSGIEKDCFFYYTRSHLLIDRDGTGPAMLNTERTMYGEELFASFRDEAGNLWLGTNSLGLFLFHTYPFRLFSFFEGQPVTNSSHAFIDSKGLLWYDNNCTLTLGQDPATGEVHHRIPNICSWVNANWTDDSLALFAYGTQHYWYSKSTRRLTPMTDVTTPVTNYLQVSPKHFILAGEGVLYHWYGRKLHPLKRFKSRKSTCNQLITAGKDNYYFATSEGLYHLRDEKWELITFEPLVERPDFRSLLLLKNTDYLLIGTDQSGILRYNTRTGKMDRLSAIPPQILSCWSIIEDRFGQLWITSNNGIVQLFTDELMELFDHRREFLTINHYQHENGIDNVEFNSRTQNKGRLLPNGDILFSSLAGPVIVHPQSNRKVVDALGNLLIDEITINEQVRSPALKRLELLEGDFVQLQFTLASFASERVLGFEYRVRGSRMRWAPLSGRQITLDNLPPGDYVLEIRATYGDRVLKLPIHVASRQPNLWIFLLITALAVAACIVFITRHLTKRAQEKKHALFDLKQQLKLLETEALRSQMNPHFIFNCLNTIQFLFISGNVTRANKYLTNFSALMRMTLDLLREPITTLDMELKATNYYVELEQLQFDEGFEFRLVNNLETPEGNIPVPSLFFQIFVENAILHGLKKTTEPHPILTLILEETPDTFVFRVCDNGPGLSEDTKEDHTSIGIRLLKERFALKSEIYNWPMEFHVCENDALINDIKTEIIITFGKVLLESSENEYPDRR